MIVRGANWLRVCILVVVTTLLPVALLGQIPPVHAAPVSCATTACAVSPIVSNAFAGDHGYVVSEAKVDQTSAYSDGGTTVYGDSNPNIHVGLMASLSNAAREPYNPVHNFRTLAISVTITDSSGNVFSPDPDASGRGGIAVSVWDTPYPTGDVDYGEVLLELATWLAGTLTGVTLPPDIKVPQPLPNGWFKDSNSITAQWTLYPSFYVGYNAYMIFDKAIKVRVIPSFFTPGVYTISISTLAERGVCFLNVDSVHQNACSGEDTQTQSYSFQYVYENDAGQAGDATNSLPNGGGTPRSILHGSYNGFLYGIDTSDVYSSYASQGQKVSFVVTPPASADFGLAIYDTSQNLIQANDLGIGATNGVAFTAAVSGTYFARISLVSGWGTYSFRLSDQFQMFPTPSSVSLGLVGAASSATSTITVKSPTDFAGRVDLTTSVTPAVPNGPAASLSTVTKTVEVSPSVVSPSTSYRVCGAFGSICYSLQNPSNAFGSDNQYAVFDTESDCCIQVSAEYDGYSVSLPPGASIVKVEIIVDHYEENNCGGVTCYTVMYPVIGGAIVGDQIVLARHSSETRDILDITGRQPSWTADTISDLSLYYYIQVYYNRSFLDWLAVRITYMTSSVTLAPGSSDTRILTVSKSPSTPTGIYTVTVTGNSGVSLSVPVTFSVQDFQITASPTSLKIPPNQSRTTTITVSPVNGFTGSVSLSANSLAGFTASFATNPITGGSGSSVLTISHTSPPASDPSTITVTGSSDGQTRTVAIIVYNPPPDFDISASPNAATLTAGSSRDFTINVSSLYGFAGSVSLSYDNPPGLTCSALSQPTITLTSASTSGSSTLSCSGPTGVYSINVTGTNGPLSHFELVAITVPGFSISASPNSVYLEEGVSGTFTINVESLYGFTGTVSLTDAVPANLTCSTITPTSVTNSGTATLSCSSSVSGRYSLIITGTSGSLSNSINIPIDVGLIASFTYDPPAPVIGETVVFTASVYGGTNPYMSQWSFGDGASAGGMQVSHSYSTTGTYTVTLTVWDSGGSQASYAADIRVGDFGLTLQSSSSVWVAQGQSGASLINVQSFNGFSGEVTFFALGMPPGSNCSFDPNPLIIAPDDLQQVVCVISASSNMALGTYSFTVRSIGRGLGRFVTVSFRVIPSPINLDQTVTFNDVIARLSGSLTDDTLNYVLYGTVYLTATNSTSGVTIASNKPVLISVTYGSNGRAVFLVEMATSPYWLSMNCSVDVTTGSSACTLYRTLDTNHDGYVDIVDAATVSNAFGSTPGSQNWNPTADLNADQRVDIVDMALIAAYYQAPAFLA